MNIVVNGEELMMIRLKKGLSRNELAIKAGLHTHTISQLERQEVIPRPKTVYKISQALEVDMEEFCEFKH